MNSKQKGNRGEREFAALCRDNGIKQAQRGQQFSGGYDSPDIKGIDFHVEVKRVERLNISAAMKQSICDCEDKAVPIVAHRRNREEWLISMRAVDWFKMYHRTKDEQK